MITWGAITRLALSSAAAAALALWPLAAPSMAAQDATLILEPTHGQPGRDVTVVPPVHPKTTCSVDFDNVRLVSNVGCGTDDDASPYPGIRLVVPPDAAVGTHQITVVAVKTTDRLSSATFTVDPPVTSSTTSTSPSTTSPPPSPTTTSPPPPPTSTNDSTPTTETSTPDPTTTAGTSSEVTTTPPVVSDVVDVGRNLPTGLAVIGALAAAIAMPRLVRRLRQRSPRWVARHLRVALMIGSPGMPMTRRQSWPATSVRLEVQMDQPQQGSLDARKDDR